jgi:hypothetical protein
MLPLKKTKRRHHLRIGITGGTGSPIRQADQTAGRITRKKPAKVAAVASPQLLHTKAQSLLLFVSFSDE